MANKEKNPSLVKVTFESLCSLVEAGLFFAIRCEKRMDLRDRYGAFDGSVFLADYMLEKSGCNRSFSCMEFCSIRVIHQNIF